MKFEQIEVWVNDKHDANLVAVQNMVLELPTRYPWNVRNAILNYARGKSTTSNIDQYSWNWKK